VIGFSQGPNFRADAKLENISALKKLGDTTWTANAGTITAKPGTSGGWLVLDKPLTDSAFFMNVKMTPSSKVGVLFRLHKAGDGWQGVYVSLSEGDQASYAVKLDANGKEISRDKLQKSDTEGGMSSAMGANMPPYVAAFFKTPDFKVRPLPKDINFPDLQPPTNAYKPGQWNAVNIVLYQDMLDPSFGIGGIVGERSGLEKVATQEVTSADYGPMALYVGGTGEVEFKDVLYRDLETMKFKETLSPQFTMQHLNGFYFSWSTAVADINHDGKPDIIAGPYYYLGPDFTEAHEIYTPHVYDPGTEYPQNNMVNLAYDWTGDGWPDVLVMSGQAGIGTATLYINPKGESRHWESKVVMRPIGNEDTLLADIDGDGKPEIIHAAGNKLAYSHPDWNNPDAPWITTYVSEEGPWGAFIGHGLGVGDINGDGRNDLVNAYGWWEQPAKGAAPGPWKYHPEAFGRWGHTQGGAGGAKIGVYDVNGDGLVDVVTALEGHGFGLAWYEQKRDGGKVTFVKHTIMDTFLDKNAGDVTFTEPHATEFADMNGDGIPDLVTGKRSLSHLFDYGDPDPLGPAVLYVYTVRRDKSAPGGAVFEPKLVHNMSGVGSHFVVTDLNGDGTPDITTSGVYGAFVFFNHMKK
jgi:hypothetical protein